MANQRVRMLLHDSFTGDGGRKANSNNLGFINEILWSLHAFNHTQLQKTRTQIHSHKQTHKYTFYSLPSLTVRGRRNAGEHDKVNIHIIIINRDKNL